MDYCPREIPDRGPSRGLFATVPPPSPRLPCYQIVAYNVVDGLLISVPTATPLRDRRTARTLSRQTDCPTPA